jgi:hypothetical protein
MDAGELAVLAAQKWTATCEFGTVAKSLAEMESKICEDPEVEVTAMLLVGAKWFEPGLLGVCLFHRTWANNVFLDFLAAHPVAMDPGHRINGIGTGLLYHLCVTARHLKAATLWIETTSGSAPFYEQIFQLPRAVDVLSISEERQDSFCLSLRRKWGMSAAS